MKTNIEYYLKQLHQVNYKTWNIIRGDLLEITYKIDPQLDIKNTILGKCIQIRSKQLRSSIVISAIVEKTDLELSLPLCSGIILNIKKKG